MHTHGSGGRRRGKPRSRILYWFRTPPGIRIGRSALDEDAIRLIEQHNPDVEFDWTRILKPQEPTGDSRGAGQPERRTRPRPREVPPSPQTNGVAVEADATPEIAEVAGFSAAVEEQPSTPEITESVDEIDQAERAVVEEFLLEPRVEEPISRPQAGDALSAVEARLGSEGLSRLRARYSEVLARISEAVSDPARQEELKATAERLNPDTWVTDEEVRAGLEHYESVFESLRSVVGRRRRRGRRRSERRRNGVLEGSERDPSEAPDDEPVDEPDPGEHQ